MPNLIQIVIPCLVWAWTPAPEGQIYTVEVDQIQPATEPVKWEVVDDQWVYTSKFCIPDDGEIHELCVRAWRDEESTKECVLVKVVESADLDGDGHVYFPDFELFGQQFGMCVGNTIKECEEE